MTLPDAGPTGTQSLTFDQWPAIQERLGDHKLAALGLVLVGPGRPGALWENHQVLAYACTPRAGGAIDLHIYDPNFPGRDDATLRLTFRAEVAYRPTRVMGVAIPRPFIAARTLRVVPQRPTTPVRGIFLMPYSRKPPPSGL